MPNEPQDFKLRRWAVNPAREDSIEWYEAQIGIKSFIVDFRAARRTTEAAEWLNTPRPFRSIGSGYAPRLEQNSYPPKTMSKEYDGLFFIDTTTGARPNPSVKNAAQTK